MRLWKPHKDKPIHRVTISLTEEEHERITEIARRSEIPLSTYIRHLIAKVRISEAE